MTDDVSINEITHRNITRTTRAYLMIARNSEYE